MDDSRCTCGSRSILFTLIISTIAFALNSEADSSSSLAHKSFRYAAIYLLLLDRQQQSHEMQEPITITNFTIMITVMSQLTNCRRLKSNRQHYLTVMYCTSSLCILYSTHDDYFTTLDSNECRG